MIARIKQLLSRPVQVPPEEPAVDAFPVIVVSTVGATGGDALDTLMAEIGPWRDKILGNVLLTHRVP